MASEKDRSPFSDFVTLRDVAEMLGSSYTAAHSLASAGLLGEAVTCGRQQLYRRDVAEAAVHRRLEQRQQNPRAPLNER